MILYHIMKTSIETLYWVLYICHFSDITKDFFGHVSLSRKKLNNWKPVLSVSRAPFSWPNSRTSIFILHSNVKIMVQMDINQLLSCKILLHNFVWIFACDQFFRSFSGFRCTKNYQFDFLCINFIWFPQKIGFSKVLVIFVMRHRSFIWQLVLFGFLSQLRKQKNPPK